MKLVLACNSKPVNKRFNSNMFAASVKIFTPVFKHFQFERVAKADPLVDIKNDE